MIEAGVFQAGQVRDVGFHEFHTEIQFAGPPARNRQLFRRNVNRGDSRSQSGESEYREVVATAQNTDVPAFHGSDQIQFLPEEDLLRGAGGQLRHVPRLIVCLPPTRLGARGSSESLFAR